LAERIADEIARIRDAGVQQVLLNPVFEEENQMESLAKEVWSRV